MQPQLYPIKGGWAALGHGWTVFGESKEEAVRRFGEAERLHEEIQGRPVPKPASLPATTRKPVVAAGLIARNAAMVPTTCTLR